MIRNVLPAIGLGLLLAASGCISCGHEACPKAIEAGPYCSAPPCDRRHVYAVLVNGLTPTSSLEDLRLGLAERGFEKSYRVELCHAGWVWREMKRVRSCDPEARFVLVGYGFGCAAVVSLAHDAAKEGIPVDAVALLDPAGVKEWHGCAERTLVIRSGAGVEGDGSCTRVDCGHFALPKHADTVNAITVLLGEAASRVEHPAFEETPMFWHPDAPAPRDYTLPEGMPLEWHFLHERRGPHSAPLVATK